MARRVFCAQPVSGSVAVAPGVVFDSLEPPASGRWRTLGISVFRESPLPWTIGAIEIGLTRRSGKARIYTPFHLGPGGLNLDVSGFDDLKLEILSADLVGYPLHVTVDEEPPVGHVDSFVWWFSRYSLAGAYTVVPNSVEVALSAVDAGWTWQGRVTAGGGLTTNIAEPATFLGGPVKGFQFTNTVAPLDIAWKIKL